MKDKRLKENTNLKPVQRFLGKIKTLSDLPTDKEFVGFLKEAIELNEKGIKVVAKKSDKPKVIKTPDYFAKKLATNPKAKEIFETKSDSFRKNYLVWITDAKTESTRNKRIEQSLEWIAEGKDRFWKYAK